MKKIKIAFLLLAVVFAVSSSFTTESSTFVPKWFVLSVGGDPFDAADYQEVSVEPSCPTTPTEVCAILANEQGATNKPVQSELDDIADDSDQFTETDSRIKYIED